MTTTNDVLSWLGKNPNLLIDHPELLDQLKLPHDVGTASLIERQVERLRETNLELKQRLSTLTRIAGDNEQLIRRLHALTLALTAEDSVAECLKTLVERLHNDFQADSVRLHLNSHPEDQNTIGLNSDEPDELSQIIVHSEWPEPLARLLDHDEVKCGRLTRKKVTALFGAEITPSLGSVAVVPLTGVGLLAIGSKQADRFYPGMGTLFLELLADTLVSRLADYRTFRRKRA